MSPDSHTQQQRTDFANISPRAWEHPADKAALSALQIIPGVDVLLQKLIGATSEKSFRLIYLASSVRVSERQFPHLHTLLQEACHILDAPYVPELYISQNPFFNAGAIGVEHPFIVLNSSVLEMLSEDEILCVIGHELGHCLSGHALYKTLLQVLLKVSLLALQIPLGGVALLPIVIALMEWNRKSELSADRAGLLVVQDPTVSYSVLMKMAGGAQSVRMDVNEFFVQAADYEGSGNMLDSVHKLLNLLFVSHPFPVIRLTELQSWIDSGDYGRILADQYVRRDEDQSQGQDNVFAQLKTASTTYKEQLEHSKDALAGVVSDLFSNIDTLRHQAMHGLDAWFDPTSIPAQQPDVSQNDQAAAGAQPSPVADRRTGDDDAEHILRTLEKLGDLKDKGIITDEDFAQQKTKLLSRL